MASGDAIPVFTSEEVVERMHAVRGSCDMSAMYSSWLGGIVRDPALMCVCLDDHMVHRGHGVFDTAALAHGRIYRLDIHLDRFMDSIARAKLQLPVGHTRDRMREIIIATVAASGRRDGSVRYWASAGPGDFGFMPCKQPTFYVVVFGALPLPDSLSLTGIKDVTIRETPLKPPLLASTKTNNYFLNCLMAMEASSHGGMFGINIDPKTGLLAESCVLNISIVTPEGVLKTPRFDGGILRGCTVRRLLEFAEILRREGLLKGVQQCDIPEEEARKAVEMIFTAGDDHCIPVTHWDGVPLGTGRVGPVAQRLVAMFKFDENNAKEGPNHIEVPYAASA